MVELLGKKWTIRFDASATTTSNGLGIVLSCENEDTMPLSFKLGFSYSNNVVEYEAYLTGLTIALCEGPFLDSAQAQVETRILGPLTRILGPLLVVYVDWAWFTATKWGLITNQVVRKSHKAPQGKM